MSNASNFIGNFLEVTAQYSSNSCKFCLCLIFCFAGFEQPGSHAHKWSEAQVGAASIVRSEDFSARGMGVVKDEAKAVRLFRHAAKLGAAEAGASAILGPENISEVLQN